MVRSVTIQDLYDVASKVGPVNLPAFKQNCTKISFNGEESEKVYTGKAPIFPFAKSDVFEASISGWRRLTAYSSECKAVYELMLDIEGSHFKFSPGDTIAVIPQNVNAEVESIIKNLDLHAQADLTYELVAESKTKLPSFLPVKATLRHVLTHCLDLRSVVKKLFILALSKHTKEESEKQILEYLCSKEGSAMYNTFVLEKKLSVLDIFQIFKSCKPPIETLLLNLPRLLPRPYSIVNSQNSDNVIKICFSVMQIDSNRRGLTTGFLEDLILNDSLEDALKKLSVNDEKATALKKVRIYLRTNMNGFKLPERKQNLLLIGPGTGVAPFIGFLEELSKQKERQIEIGETWLFFGCRDPKLDFIYEEELRSFMALGVLSRMETAFSRIENVDVKHVQDAIARKGEEIVKFIEDGAMIFVCGDLKTMAAAVRETIKTCFIRHAGKSLDDAEKYMKDLESSKRYVTDIWS